MEIILASASPRRRELLQMLGLKDFKVIPALKEEADVTHLEPGQAVKSLSEAKAREAASRAGGDCVVIGADTVVFLDGENLGKPADRQQACEMLSRLSGRSHQVFTGVTVIRGQTVISEYESTLVHFRPMTRREIEAYVDTGEPMDKAGAYGAQGIGALFVQGIQGDFFNVMGLPLCRLSEMLEKVGVRLI